MSYKQFACPKCSSAVRVPDTIPGGSTLKCPTCQGLFRLPVAQTSTPSAPVLPRPVVNQPPVRVPVPATPRPVVNQPPARVPVPTKPRPVAGQSPARRPVPVNTTRNLPPPPFPGPNSSSLFNSKKKQLILGAGIGGGAALLLLLMVVVLSGAFSSSAGDSADGSNPEKAGNNPGGTVLPVHNPVQKIDPLAEGRDPFADLEQPQGKPLLVLNPNGHAASVRVVLFTPDGKKLITVSLDKTIRIWNVATGETERVFHMPIGPAQEGVLYAAALSRDGKKLAIGGVPVGGGLNGFPVYLLSLESGQVERTFKGHDSNIGGLDFSPDGNYLVSASMDGNGLIHDLKTGQTIRKLQGDGTSLRSISYSPDGQLVATTGYNKTARIWNAATGQPVALLDPSAGPMLSHCWSPDGQTLATGTFERTIQLWTRTGQLKRSFTVPQPEKTQFTSLKFTRDGKELLYTGIDTTGRAGIFNVQTGQHRLIFPNHNNTVMNGTISPNGELAATTGGDDHETYIWRVKDGRVLHKLQGTGRAVWGVGWSKDGKSIAWGNTNFGNTQKGTTALERSFDLTTFRFGPAPDPRDYNRAQLNTPTGFFLQPLDFFRVGVLKNGQTIHNLQSPHNGDRVYSCSALPKDRVVLGASFGMFLMDLNTGRQIREFKGHSSLILGVAPSPDGRFFLSGSDDQTICLWSPEKSEPLLSFFFAGDDWIAWTPGGYYACSANGERLMGWQINNGTEALASYYDAVRFRQSLFRPEVLKQVVKTGDLNLALAQAGEKDPDQSAQLTSVAQVLPPQVRIVTPEGDRGEIKVNQGRLEVTAAAKSVGEHPVTAMRLIVDGRPYRGTEGLIRFEKTRLGVRSATWNVQLPPGKHLLQVQAESTVSKAVSDPLFLAFEGGDKQLPNLYVLAVGINEYAGDAKLNFATKDAAVLTEVLQTRSTGLFGKVEVNLLTDHAATRANIMQGLNWMQAKMTANDVGIFFFGGHGLRDPWGNFHLVPVDVKLTKPRETCLSGETVKKSLANMPGKLIAIFDACHSGAAAAPDDLVRDLVTEDYGIIVMCSSLGSEYSLESGLIEHGVFTLGLVEGLKGGADFDNDRIIFVHEMDRFACHFVKQLTKGMQNPITARPPSIPSFALTKK